MTDAMEKSNLVIAKVLDMAMKNGIAHWSLEYSDLDLDDSYRTFFYPCINWLEAEGLIRVGSVSRTLGGLANGSVENISLTAHGMAVLNQKIEVAGNQVTLSETVTAVSEGSVSYNKIGDAIGGLIAGFVKAIGS
jgi:hypothetical protein